MFPGSTAAPQNSSAGVFAPLPASITPDHPDATVQPAKPRKKITFGLTPNIPKEKPKVSSEDDSAEFTPIVPGSPLSAAPVSQAPLTATVGADEALSEPEASPQQHPADDHSPEYIAELRAKLPIDIKDQILRLLDPSVPRPPELAGYFSANPVRDDITAMLGKAVEAIIVDLVKYLTPTATRVIEEHVDRLFVSTAACRLALLESQIREEITPRIEEELKVKLKGKAWFHVMKTSYDEICKHEKKMAEWRYQETLEQERKDMRATVLEEKSVEISDRQKDYDAVNNEYLERQKDLDNINKELGDKEVEKGILTKEVKSLKQNVGSLRSSKKNEVEDNRQHHELIAGQVQRGTPQNSTASDHDPSASLAGSPPSKPATATRRSAAVGQSAGPRQSQLASNAQAPGVSVATTTVTASPPSSIDDQPHTPNVSDANDGLRFGIGSGAGVSRLPPVQGAQKLAASSKRARRSDSDSDVRRESKRFKIEEDDELATEEPTYAPIGRTRSRRGMSDHIVDQTLYGVEDDIGHPRTNDWSGSNAAPQSNSPPIKLESGTSKGLEETVRESVERGQSVAGNASKLQTVYAQASEAGSHTSATDADEMAEIMATGRKRTKTKKETAAAVKAMSALKQHRSEDVDHLLPIEEEAEEASVMDEPAKRRPGRPRKNIVAPQAPAPAPAVVGAPTRSRRGPKTNTEPATAKLERVTDGRVQKQTTNRYPRRHNAQPQQMALVDREEEEEEEEL